MRYIWITMIFFLEAKLLMVGMNNHFAKYKCSFKPFYRFFFSLGVTICSIYFTSYQFFPAKWKNKNKKTKGIHFFALYTSPLQYKLGSTLGFSLPKFPSPQRDTIQRIQYPTHTPNRHDRKSKAKEAHSEGVSCKGRRSADQQGRGKSWVSR